MDDLPQPSGIQILNVPEHTFASIISLDMMEYLKKRNKKAVKKTPSIPS